MFELTGKYGTAKVYADIIEEEAISQIIQMLNMPFTQGAAAAIMPDVHAGAGCTIGTTLQIKDCVTPNLVGVDIGCGVTMSRIDKINLSEKTLQHLDNVIREFIPSGYDVRDSDFTNKGKKYKSGRTLLHKLAPTIQLENLKCAQHVNIERAYSSIGTLGGGNHYIELDKSSDGIYLCVHSGSRSLGKAAAQYYQKLAVKECRKLSELSEKEIESIREECKGNKKRIGEIILMYRKTGKNNVPDSLCWLDRNKGNIFSDYLHDMAIIQKYADVNRHAIISEICLNMEWTHSNEINTIHNYIDTEDMILRKGAVSAKLGEKLIIPMNMRDGILICKGKGNKEWNCSAPHGAGRLMSRSKAKENVALKEFQHSMEGIFTTSVNKGTLDESPMVYKPMESIVSAIEDTVQILEVAAPIYNFKAAEQEKVFTKNTKAKQVEIPAEEVEFFDER